LSVLVNEEVPEEDRDLPDKLQYSLTNLVTNICYNIGYDGVVYQSSKDYSSLNYALFCKYTKGEDIEVLDVEV
jgi:hypothetical protein